MSYIISFKSRDRSKAFSNGPAVVMRLHPPQILFTEMCKCISDSCLLLEKHSLYHDMSGMLHNCHLCIFVISSNSELHVLNVQCQQNDKCIITRPGVYTWNLKKNKRNQPQILIIFI